MGQACLVYCSGAQLPDSPAHCSSDLKQWCGLSVHSYRQASLSFRRLPCTICGLDASSRLITLNTTLNNPRWMVNYPACRMQVAHLHLGDWQLEART